MKTFTFYRQVMNTLGMKHMLLLIMSIFAQLVMNAQLINLPVTGYNHDLVANGVGAPNLSTTSDLDAAGTNGYVFVDGTYKYATACSFGPFTANIAPASNTITSTAAPGLVYNLQAYAGNNALRVPVSGVAAGSGLLSLITPVAAANIYLLCVSGGGAITSGITVTVTFSDATTQVFSNQTTTDWCNTTSAGNYTKITTTTYLRAQIPGSCIALSTCQYFAEMSLAILPANYGKLISSITVAKTTTTNVFSVFAVGCKPPCTSPATQATALNLSTISISDIGGTFTPATGTPSGYVVVSYPTGAIPVNPANGTTYTAGQSLGSGRVIQSGTSSTFTATGLNGGSMYDFYVYAYNTGTTCGGPTYNITSPLSGSQTTSPCGTLSGIIPVGPTAPASPAGFPSITAAKSYINANGLGGNTILELQSDYTSAYAASNETFPMSFTANACINATRTLTIQPSSAVSSPILFTAAGTLATIDFNGASYITIDGRPGGSGTTSMIAIQNTLGTLPALRFINDASNITITYCNIMSNNSGATATATGGVILFGSTTGINGNDNNTIDHCDIHNISGGNPLVGINSLGSTGTVLQNNDANIISNCNIYDFYSATLATAGIYVGAGNGSWTITNNHVYQTVSRNYTAVFTHRGFWITPNTGTLTSASGFNISGNYIGGNAADGTGNYTLTGTIAYNFYAMDLSLGMGTVSEVQNNTLTNWNMTGGFSANNIYGINVANGNVNIGTSSGNLIGSATTTGAITITTTVTNGSFIGLRSGGGGTINFSNNIISGINMFGNATTVATGFNGIACSGGLNLIVNNNTVGSATLANSINMVSTSSTSTTATAVRGIINNSATVGATNTITNNLVANINNNYSGTGAQACTMAGIAVTSGTSTMSGNTIQNLSSNTQTTSGGSTPALVGITYTSTTAPTNISNNVIHTLKLTHPTTLAAMQLTGLYYAGPTTASSINQIQKNFIHSLSMMSPTNSIAFMTGIDLASGLVTVKNNMIRLGYNDNGIDIATPCFIRGLTESTATASIYNNTIFIGGVTNGTIAANTFAFQRTATTNADDMRNNIFVNNRSNATTGGKHYQVYLGAGSATLTLDYNNYFGTGVGSVFAYNGTSDVAVYSPSWIGSDVNSVVGDPSFIDPAGSALTVDLHINTGIPTPVEQTGAFISSVTDDYDGQTRSGLTPNDIGADAGNFTPLSLCAGTPPATTAALTNPAPLCVSGSKTIILAGFFTQPGLSYQWQESSTGLPGSFVNVSSGTGGTSVSYNTPVLTAPNYYQCIVKCTISGDSTISSSVQVVINPNPVLTITPASGTAVCSGSNVDLVATGAASYTWSCNPGVSGYPAVSLFSTPNNTAKVTSRPTSTLASSTATPPATVATGTWVYTVVGTDAAGCSSSASVSLTVSTAAVVPLQLTYTYAPNPTCAPGTPITFTVNNNGTIGTGQWTYNWYDNTGAYLFQSTTNTAATDTFTPVTPVSDGRQTFTVKVSNTLCPSSYAVASPTFFVGYTSLIVPTDANCGDNGSISIYPEGQTDFNTWYSNNFSTGLQGPAFDAIYGSTNFTGGLCNITPQSNSQNGTFLVRNPANINTNDLQVDFKMSTAPRGFAFNILGADGMAWSYGPDVFQGALTPGNGGFNAECGSGTGFKLAFDATANGANNTPGAYLMFNCTTPDQGPTSPGVLAFKQGSFWQGLVNAPVSILISENGYVTVTVNNQVIFDHVALPSAYLTSNKSTWIHAFTARTGGSNELHAIDDLNIRYNNYEYSINSTSGVDGTWQQSNIFSGLTPGTYPVWVRKVSDPSCFTNTGNASINIAPPPGSALTVPAPGYLDVVCYGNSTNLTADIYVPGASFLWESSNSASGPWNPAPGINSNPTYTTAGLTSSTYFRITFTCPSSVPVEANPILVTVNAGSIASTNSPQLLNCVGNSVTLTAVPGASTSCVWYDVASGGSPLAAGNSYVATPASLPATYYVEPVTTVYSNHYFNGGQTVISNGFGTASSGSNIATRFSTSASIIIDSIKVIPSATGTLIIALQNAGSATNISSYSMTITTAMVGNFTNIPVNLTVPGSGNYQLINTGVACTYYSSYSGSYSAPYMSLGGVFSITGAALSATGAASTASYGVAFRVAISSSCPAGSGARVPVIIQPNPAYAVITSPSASTLCVGAIQALSASSANAYSNYSWTPVTDLFTDAAATIAYTGTNTSLVYVKPSSSGLKTYTVSTAGSGCTNTALTAITVNSLPSILASSTPSVLCTGANAQLSAAVAENNYAISSIPFAPELVPATVSTTTGDEGNQVVNIGFTFGYFGASYSDARIHANGYIQLGGTTPLCTTCYSPPIAPAASTPNNWVGIWADLNVTAGQVTYATTGVAPNRKFVVNYNNVNFFSATPATTHQIILNEFDNSIEIHLTSNVTTSTLTRALGIENAAGTAAFIPPGRNSGTWTATNESWKFMPILGSYQYDWSANTSFLNASNIANPIAQSMTASQTYTVQVTDASTSCTNTQSVAVTVNQPSSSGMTETACDTYTWNSTTYSTTGVYTSTISNAAGCDSVMTLNLTINNSSASNSIINSCGSYTWAANGVTYTVSGIYTYTSLNTSGCLNTDTLNLSINSCNTTLNLVCFIEGYWDGAGAMLPVLQNQGQPNSATECDSITVELYNAATLPPTPPYIPDYTVQTILHTNGTATATFSSAISGNYYVVIKHRNALQTWSASALSLPSTTAYNFSTAATQAYGSNQTEVSSGVWAFYSGDAVPDENMDLLDLGIVETDISDFAFGYYYDLLNTNYPGVITSDINGDGNVDLLDSPALEANISNFVFASHP